MLRTVVRLSLAVVLIVLSLPAHVAGATPAATPNIVATSSEWIAGPAFDGRYVVWSSGGQIYVADLAEETTTVVAAGDLILGANTWCPDTAIENGILAWSRATGETDVEGAALYSILVQDLATAETREITAAADAQCPLRLDSGRLTYHATGGFWLHDLRAAGPSRHVWPDDDGAFIGLSGDWAVGLLDLDVDYGARLKQSRVVARHVVTGETRVLDEGWSDSDLPSLRGVVNDVVAYTRLYSTREEASKREGLWLAVTDVNGATSEYFPWWAGSCANPGIQINGDAGYLLVSCHGAANRGEPDLWVTDVNASSVFLVTLDPHGSVTAALAGGLLVWSQQHDDGGFAILSLPWSEALPDARQAPPFDTRPEATYFPETGHNLHFAFKSYWEHNGGLPVFGYPLTEEFFEKNADTGQFYITQYFERQRFEFHAENQGTPYEVLLGRLGAEVAARDGLLATEPFRYRDDDEGPDAGCRYFAVTGHYVCAAFRIYWEERGLDLGDRGITFRESLALFGYPISEPFVATNGDGHHVLTQYFERAVFEWHPQNPDPYKVLLRRLGIEILAGESDAQRGDYALAAFWDEALPGSDFGMGLPGGIAAGQDGHVYVTDLECSCIQVYRRDGTLVTQFVVRHSEDPDGPTLVTGIDQDSSGLLYVTDSLTGAIHVFSPEWGPSTIFNGLTIEPRDLAIDSRDTIYVVDGSGKVVKLDTTGQVLASWGGVGGAVQFDDPHGIAVDRHDDIYVADTGNQRIVKLSPQGEVLGIADLSDALYERAPIDVAVDAGGFLYVIDSAAGTVWVLTQKGEVMRMLEIVPDYQFEQSKYMRLDIDEHDLLWITPGGGVSHYTRYGVLLDTWFDAQRGTLRWLFGMTVAPNGDVLAVNRIDGWVYAFDSGGRYLTGWGRGSLDDIQLSGPTDIVVDHEGRIFVADPGNSLIVVYGPEYGVKLTEWAFVLDTGERVGPMTLALDNDGFLYVTTYGHVRVYSVDGDLVRGWGAGGSGLAVLGDIVGIAVFGDFVYVVDNTDHRIVVFNREGDFIREIAGAVDAQGNAVPFTDLREIKTDGLGNLYLANPGGSQILKLTPEGIVLAKIAGVRWPWDLAVSPEGVIYAPWFAGWDYGIGVLVPAR